MEENFTDKEMTNEEILEAISQNEFLKLNLKIMNGLEIVDKEGTEEPDYNELYKKIALKDKKNTLVEYNPESMNFYYQLITNGYECFGEEYMYKFVQEYPEFTVLVLHLFIGYAESITEYLTNLEENSNK